PRRVAHTTDCLASNHSRSVQRTRSTAHPNSTMSIIDSKPVSSSRRQVKLLALQCPVRPSSLGAMRVALVHDWLVSMRGGEKCLEVFCELFPGADLYTLIEDPQQVSAVIRKMTTHV